MSPTAMRMEVGSVRAALHRTLFWGLLLLLLLFFLLSGVSGTEMCTKSVPVQREPSKKVHVLRRVPASCSNWEKAWSWITNKDCGTKYRLDLVDIPSQKVVTYRTKKVCCEGDLKCKKAEANGLEAGGMEVSDQKFLAIVLGSTAAAVFVLVLVISISLCRKKKQCTLLCEERRHIYASAEDAEESSELQARKGEEGCRGEEEETENKVCESEYAEINDSGLPRYTDIFKEAGGREDHPFARATAPPLCTYEARQESSLGAAGVICSADCADSNVKEVLQGTADILHMESLLSRQQQQQQQHKGQQTQVKTQQRRPREPDHEEAICHDADTDYVNVTSTPGSISVAHSGDGGVVVGEVLSLTKDDPAVVTGDTSSSPASPFSSSSAHPPPPLPPPLHYKESAICDMTNSPSLVAETSHTAAETHEEAQAVSDFAKDGTGSERCGSSLHYDCLAERDSHEYQRLLTPHPRPSDDIEMTRVHTNDDDDDDVEIVANESSALRQNAESTASC